MGINVDFVSDPNLEKESQIQANPTKARKYIEQLQAENKRLKGVIEKYARHTHRCFMGQYNSLKTGKGCDCGLSEAIKTISKE